jgi:hypothetical protein
MIESLLEASKQELLSSLQSYQSNETEANIIEARDNENIEDDHIDLLGLKCQAPLDNSWGTSSYHNAIISNYIEDGTPDLSVRVMFTHPCFPSMKPCQFFMEGHCKFTDDACRYSHGHIVPFSELKPYNEPDHNNIVIGARCLVKQDDGLWLEANIRCIGEKVTVQYINQRMESDVNLEDIFPIENNESSSSGDEEDNDEDDDGSDVDDSQLLNSETVVRTLESQSAQDVLGEWEKHTKGIGSKLMAKMGYILGQGLGKNNEGRVEPVQIEILPPGKSLDACAEYRANKKITKRRKRNRGINRKRKMTKQEVQEVKVNNTFEFLNKKIASTSNDEIESPKRKITSKGNLNVKLYSIQEEIKTVNKNLLSLQKSFTRNKGRDDVMMKHLTEKLSKTEKELETLMKHEKEILTKIQEETNRKKLRIF